MNQDSLFKALLSFPYESHVVYHVEDSDGITVIRFLHKRMDAKNHLSATQKMVIIQTPCFKSTGSLGTVNPERRRRITAAK